MKNDPSRALLNESDELGHEARASRGDHAALKLWLLGAVLVSVVLPVRSAIAWVNIGSGLLGMALLGVVVGIVESTMARFRLLRVPYLLVGASVLSVLAVILGLR